MERASPIAVIRAAGAAAVHEPVIAALVLAGFVDLISGAPLSRGGLLFVVAVALVVDELRSRWRPIASTATRGRGIAMPGPSLGSSLALVGFAAVVGSFARYSWPATIAVAVPAVAAVALAWRWSAQVPAQRGDERLDGLGATIWLALFVALALWELVALLGQPTLAMTSYDHPTISYLMDGVLASHAGRSITLAMWLASGWYLLRR